MAARLLVSGVVKVKDSQLSKLGVSAGDPAIASTAQQAISDAVADVARRMGVEAEVDLDVRTV